MKYEFPPWLLDDESRQLVTSGEPRHVTPKGFDLLVYLLQQRPRVVAKAELLARLWPDVVVAEATLAGLVADVRAALGDDAKRPRWIRTAHGRGYAFCADANEQGGRHSAVSHRLYLERREIDLNPGENLLGRTPEATVWIDSGSVSRRHARIVVDATGATVEDLGSKNGTFLCDEPVTSPRRLQDGDTVRTGTVSFTFRTLESDATESTA